MFSENERGQKLSRALLASAGDSLNRAVQELSEKKPHYLKHCVHLTFHSIALIFKAKLACEHPLLMYKHPGKAINDSSETVTFGESIERLANCGVKIEIDRKFLNNLQDSRNRVEHFLPEPDEQRVISNLVKVYQFIHFFLKKELGVDLDKFVGAKEKGTLLEFAHGYEKKEAAIREQMAHDFSGVSNLLNESCGKCGLKFHYFSGSAPGEKSKCYFCENVQAIDPCLRCKRPTVWGMCEECELDYIQYQADYWEEQEEEPK